MLVFKLLHILSMFAAVTTLFATQLMLVEAVRHRDAAAIHRIARHGHLIENVGVGLFFVGIGFGVATAITGSFNLIAPWLVIAYVLVIVILVVGGLVESPIMARLAEAAKAAEATESAEASGDGSPADELVRQISRSRLGLLTIASSALYAAVIYVMVFKPFT